MESHVWDRPPNAIPAPAVAVPATRPVLWVRVLRLLLLLSSLLVALSFIPTPYTLKAPGRADDLSKMVVVQGARREFRGKLLMTTVIYERANLFFCLYAALDPASEL
ncbi:MAG: hypothetical protein ACYCW6_13240, partial [Candidatus Xenobia bacterium]